MYEYDSSDALGAGSYPSPFDEEQFVIGEVTVTYKICSHVPKNWDRERIEEDIVEYLDEYILDIREFKDIEIDI